MPYKDRNDPRWRYIQQRGNAFHRGIKFLLSFEEWWKIWEKSGFWSKRGKRKGNYVMARYNDRGSYKVGNVEITRIEENARDGAQKFHSNRPPSWDKKVSKILVKRNKTKKQREAVRQKNQTKSHRQKVSEGAKRRWKRWREERMMLLVILLASELALPIPRTTTCPEGYTSQGGYCAPVSERSRPAVPKVGNCPSGWAASNNYCVRNR